MFGVPFSSSSRVDEKKRARPNSPAAEKRLFGDRMQYVRRVPPFHRATKKAVQKKVRSREAALDGRALQCAVCSTCPALAGRALQVGQQSTYLMEQN